VAWLFIRNPHAVLFNVIEYQARFRRVNWGNATKHDIEVLMSWIDSSQALLLGLLAAAGILFVVYRSKWDAPRRAEFYLCGWLAAGMSAELLTSHPTFERYFLFTVPFLAILAVAGLYAIGASTYHPDRPMWPVLILGTLISLGFAKSFYDDPQSHPFKDVEGMAAKVDQVTPAGATIWADEFTFFLTRRTPPSGMEFSYSHKLELPDAEATPLHILTNAKLKQLAAQGVFSTVETCEDTETIESFNLPRLYSQRAKVGDCDVFWDRVPASPVEPIAPRPGK
jgi:hypothetical protein